jgi:hypothetical protein
MNNSKNNAPANDKQADMKKDVSEKNVLSTDKKQSDYQKEKTDPKKGL